RMTMMMTDNGPMTAEQAATLKRLAKDAYELDAYKPNLTRAEADKCIAMLTAKLSCLTGHRIRSEAERDSQTIRRPWRPTSPSCRSCCGARRPPRAGPAVALR